MLSARAATQDGRYAALHTILERTSASSVGILQPHPPVRMMKLLTRFLRASHLLLSIGFTPVPVYYGFTLFGKGVAQLDRRRNVCYADEYDCARAVEVQNYEFPPAMNDAIVSSRTTEHNYTPE